MLALCLESLTTLRCSAHARSPPSLRDHSLGSGVSRQWSCLLGYCWGYCWGYGWASGPVPGISPAASQDTSKAAILPVSYLRRPARVVLSDWSFKNPKRWKKGKKSNNPKCFRAQTSNNGMPLSSEGCRASVHGGVLCAYCEDCAKWMKPQSFDTPGSELKGHSWQCVTHGSAW